MPDPIPGAGTEPETEPEPWTPPTCYVHVAPDGSYEIVDADGKPFASPPLIKASAPNGDVTFTDPWGNEVPHLYPPAGEPPAGFTPPECYVHLAPDGSYQIVDSDGAPIPSPPLVKASAPNGDVTFTDPWGNEIPSLYPPAGTAPDDWPPVAADHLGSEYYIVDHGNGSYDLYDQNRVLVPRGPGPVNYAKLDYDYDQETGTYRYYASDGSVIPPLPKSFTPPECFVHRSPDGGYQIVDSDGNLLPSPPLIKASAPNGDVTFTDPWGNEIESFYPPAGEAPEGFDVSFFVHVGADGTLTAVDSTGNPLPCQPEITRIVDGSGAVHYTDPWGNEVNDLYDPLSAVEVDLSDMYIHVAPDGTFQVVDGDGQLVPSPPNVVAMYDQGQLVFHDKDGNEIDTFYPPPGAAPAGFTPPECYVHIAPDGTYQVVDANGNLLPSPPNVTADFHLGNQVFHDPWGNEIPTFYPPAGAPPTDWPPPGQDEEPATEETSAEDDGPEDDSAEGDTEPVGDAEPAVEPEAGEAGATEADTESPSEPEAGEAGATEADTESPSEPEVSEAGATEAEPEVGEAGASEADTESPSEPEVSEAGAGGADEVEDEVASPRDRSGTETEPEFEGRGADSEVAGASEPVVAEGVGIDRAGAIFDADERMTPGEDAVADVMEPGFSVLPTPLSVEDTMAIAEGGEPAAVDRGPGMWEPSDEFETEMGPAFDANAEFVEIPEEEPALQVAEVAAPAPEPLVEAAPEYRVAVEDAEAEQPAPDTAPRFGEPEAAANLEEIPGDEPEDAPLDVAEEFEVEAVEVEPVYVAEEFEVEAVEVEPVDVAEEFEVEAVEVEPVDVAEEFEVEAVEVEPVYVAEEFEVEAVEVEPVDVAEEFEVDDLRDELLDEPVLLDMSEIEDDIELLEVDELET